ncbi:MAG: ribokinase [Alkaliphilus sp.]
MKNIVVIGSMNVDLVVEVDRKPLVGETLSGKGFQIFQGGKGANQCVAAARLGGNCTMLGSVGVDTFAKSVIENLQSNSINVNNINKNNNLPTGTAVIEVYPNDNSIIVVSGANSATDVEYVQKYKELLLESDMVLLQLEIPLETVEWVVDFLWSNNKQVILNPAPASKLSEKILEKITFITPNEHECSIVFGSDKSAEYWMRKYPNKLIITEGEKGVKYYDGKKICRIPSVKVEVVDTTGAGDTFNGALALFIAEGNPLKEALYKSCIAGALAVTKLGAQEGMPLFEEFNEYMQIYKTSKFNQQTKLQCKKG